MPTEDTQGEQARPGADHPAPKTEPLEEENPLGTSADPGAAHKSQPQEEGEAERQEQREAEEKGSGRGAV